MKKFIAIILSAALALSLAACSSPAKQPELIGGNTTASDETVTIANPFTDYETLADAITAASFDITVPDHIDGYPQTSYRVMDSDGAVMIELINEDGSENEVRIRKAPGSDDISGDYNEYAQEQVLMVGDRDVTAKGDGDTVSLATWAQDGYTYSVYASSGMTSDALAALIADIQ